MKIWPRLRAWVVRGRREPVSEEVFRGHTCGTLLDSAAARGLCAACQYDEALLTLPSYKEGPGPEHFSIRQEDLDALQADWDALRKSGLAPYGYEIQPDHDQSLAGLVDDLTPKSESP